jgi:hypothetical protein
VTGMLLWVISAAAAVLVELRLVANGAKLRDREYWSELM